MILQVEKKNKILNIIATKRSDLIHARVVELVDTRDLKSLDRNIVPVQVRPRVPFKINLFITWLDGRVVMQRPAKPFTPVRFRLQPPQEKKYN